MPKADAPGLNRHDRRKAAKSQQILKRSSKRDYGMIYHHFRGRWLKAFHELTAKGLLISRIEDDGKQHWILAEAATAEERAAPPVPLGHREAFLTDPEVLAYICDYLKSGRLIHRRKKYKYGKAGAA